MAKPIALELPARDPRKELIARLEAAPAEHAEALLASYEFLQDLHDHRVFDVLHGALSASDKLVADRCLDRRIEGIRQRAAQYHHPRKNAGLHQS